MACRRRHRLEYWAGTKMNCNCCTRRRMQGKPLARSLCDGRVPALYILPLLTPSLTMTAHHLAEVRQLLWKRSFKFTLRLLRRQFLTGT